VSTSEFSKIENVCLASIIYVSCTFAFCGLHAACRLCASLP